MIKQIKGQVTAGKGTYAIVISRFNEFITDKLLAGAIDCLQRHGAADEQISVVWVPGASQKNWHKAANTSPSFVSVLSYAVKPAITITSVSR
jgi:6,7-dimethyl-8-ribityllumazine synthase